MLGEEEIPGKQDTVWPMEGRGLGLRQAWACHPLPYSVSLSRLGNLSEPHLLITAPTSL